MKIENLTLAFSNKTVVKNVNIEINPSEFIFLIWLSWSGKTSIIRSIIWDFKPVSWDIILDNWEPLYKNLNDKLLSAYRRNIWVIFQDYKLMESKSVYENVAFAMEVCWYNDKYIQKKVPETLEQVKILSKKDKFVSELSWGEKQRVSIARALVHNPSIIIWDEPTWNLDPITAMDVMNIFVDLNKEWKTIIIATHDKNIVDKLKKRVVVFKDKEMVSDKKNGIYEL
jgi:cell division transport system ATP-binding protein